MRFAQGRLFKMATIFALIMGVMAAGLWGGRGSTLAHEAQPQTFMVDVGAISVSNVEAMAFSPAILKVHRGDTVMWHFNSFHNVHFEDSMAEFAIFPIVDGQPLPQLNPAAAFPSIANGATYAGGDANSGMPEGSVAGVTGTFTLVIDAPVGRYMYFCDLHAGMVGVIEVVADDVEIPSPAEVAALGVKEMGEHLAAGQAVLPQFQGAAPVRSEDGVLNITAGSGGTGRSTVNLFNSPAGIIQAGETVTWTVPADSIEPHFVNSSPYDPMAVPEVVPVEQKDGPPIMTLGPGFLGTTADGTVIKAGDTFNSAFILPGASFSLTFADAGVYFYNCHIHPGMQGMIVVEPKV